MTSPRPVVVSMGEPSGIGPEVAVKAWAALDGHITGRPIQLVGARSVFLNAATQCGLDTRNIEAAIIDLSGEIQVRAGKPSLENANAVISAISESVRIVLSQKAAALITAPIHKAILTAAGFAYPGHTEYLAALTGVERAIMMLSTKDLSPALRVIPMTVHTALKNAVLELTTEGIVTCGEIVLGALKHDFGLTAPRLAVAGLNPHAGEDGTMGREDLEIISPAIAALRDRGHAVSGPYPADTLFHDEARLEYDAVLCMYHDQALIPIKTLAFWDSVNITLGLPIVRTSPDHGTALDIAGRGVANPQSTIAAIHAAAEIADRRGL